MSGSISGFSVVKTPYDTLNFRVEWNAHVPTGPSTTFFILFLVGHGTRPDDFYYTKGWYISRAISQPHTDLADQLTTGAVNMDPGSYDVMCVISNTYDWHIIKTGQYYDYATMPDELTVQMPSQSAHLSVTSSPSGAEVELKDISTGLTEYVGTTPLSQHEISAGQYTLRVAKTGYYVWERNFVATPGDSVSFNASLVSAVITWRYRGHSGADRIILGCNTYYISSGAFQNWLNSMGAYITDSWVEIPWAYWRINNIANIAYLMRNRWGPNGAIFNPETGVYEPIVWPPEFIWGYVTDLLGIPLPLIRVGVEGTDTHVVTNHEGFYDLNPLMSGDALQITASDPLGRYAPQTKSVYYWGDPTRADFIMWPV